MYQTKDIRIERLPYPEKGFRLFPVNYQGVENCTLRMSSADVPMMLLCPAYAKGSNITLTEVDGRYIHYFIEPYEIESLLPFLGDCLGADLGYNQQNGDGELLHFEITDDDRIIYSDSTFEEPKRRQETTDRHCFFLYSYCLALFNHKD